ncbi:MAG TPA: bifunctional alpha/beta hydrolase/class I SAM-dependent methyltransferase [Bryobacteraceae bacterium]|nr:bifunctional alpha/beta hydrolase/class I SAM-dependent methyltransferase [Bryobacteraceae bacterium]
MIEQFFTTWDGTQLFYRAWLPETPPEAPPEHPATRALVLFHRGHEHSGRFDELARTLGLAGFAVFAWDARGHGRSRHVGQAVPPALSSSSTSRDSFACLVRDADCFVKHLVREHRIAIGNVAVVAHSVGAVIAAAWVHDYAPRIRALVLASPAFRVKLYVPFALQFLRLQRHLQPNASVRSYVRPGMLTHDQAESESYARDPLISRAVSVNLLVDMHDAATRIVGDAGAIRTPTLLLASGKDYVVRLPVQREFFRRLGSPFKEMREYAGFYHDLWHERDRTWPIQHAREFLLRAFDLPVEHDLPPANQAEYERLSRPPAALSPAALKWGTQRLFLKFAGKLSHGIGAGWRSGFDSGDSLDYVYRNQPEGVTPLGRLIDRVYLNSPGWRGIRQRKQHVEELLRAAIGLIRAEGRPVHIFDPAAGGGRYVIETVSRLGGPPVSVTLRDFNPANVEAASKLARELKFEGLRVEQGDAFDRRSLAGLQPRPAIAIVSGLYELFADNHRVRESLLGLADALGDHGYLIYTNQPWHPQLEMIARVLANRDGRPWVMRCRPQAEMDSLVERAGFEKLETRLDADGIFTVSLARRRPPARELEPGLSRASGAGAAGGLGSAGGLAAGGPS